MQFQKQNEAQHSREFYKREQEQCTNILQEQKQYEEKDETKYKK